MICPSQRAGWGLSGVLYACNYAINYSAAGRMVLTDVRYPAGMIMLTETTYRNYHQGTRAPTGYDGWPAKSAYRHNDGMNIGFMDGHSKWYKHPLPTTPSQDLHWRPNGT